MSISQFDSNNATLNASGTFCFCDHVEGCVADDNPWTATGIIDEGIYKWNIRRAPAGPHHVIFTHRATGEPLFCLGEKANEAIKIFIAKKLTYFGELLRENPTKNASLIEEPARYTGIKSEYTGPCVCHKISVSDILNPFNWWGHTIGRNYPNDCFKCSCGNKWYQVCPAEELWGIVRDITTWELLLEFNGVAVEAIVDDLRIAVPAIILLRVLRHDGFIPIP